MSVARVSAFMGKNCSGTQTGSTSVDSDCFGDGFVVPNHGKDQRSILKKLEELVGQIVAIKPPKEISESQMPFFRNEP